MLKYERGLPNNINTSNSNTCWTYNDCNTPNFYFGEDGIITSYN